MHIQNCCADKPKSEVSSRSGILNQWDMSTVRTLKGAFSNSDSSSPGTVYPAKYRNVCLHGPTHMGIGQVCLLYQGIYIFPLLHHNKQYSSYKVEVVWGEEHKSCSSGAL